MSYQDNQFGAQDPGKIPYRDATPLTASKAIKVPSPRTFSIRPLYCRKYSLTIDFMWMVLKHCRLERPGPAALEAR